MIIEEQILSVFHKNKCCGYSLESPRHLYKNICCRYSLESTRQGDSNECLQHMFLSEVILMSTHNICFYGGRGDSNEYPQHMFLSRNKQKYPIIITKYPSYLFHWELPIRYVRKGSE